MIKRNNNNSNIDTYETLKNEFFTLSNNILTIYNSLNYNNNTMKDIYLNSNSFLHNLSNYYGGGIEQHHPLGDYSNAILNNVQKTFDEWTSNQNNHFKLINEYCAQFDIIKNNIQRLDQITNTASPEYINLKNQIFQDVQTQFNNRVSNFDIPLINIQFSFNSCLQTLNTNHLDSSSLLQKPINYHNPVASLKPTTVNTTSPPQQPYRQPPQPQQTTTAKHLATNNQLPHLQRPAYQPPKQIYNVQQQPTYPTHPTLQEQQPIEQQPPPPQGPRKPKAQLKQLERPQQIEMPDAKLIEPNIQRKPGDFLRDPNAPRYEPAPVERYVSKNHSQTLDQHNVPLSESYKQRVVLSNNINTPPPPSRHVPPPPPQQHY